MMATTMVNWELLLKMRGLLQQWRRQSPKLTAYHVDLLMMTEQRLRLVKRGYW